MLAALRKPDLTVAERGGLLVGLAPEADRNEVRGAILALRSPGRKGEGARGYVAISARQFSG